MSQRILTFCAMLAVIAVSGAQSRIWARGMAAGGGGRGGGGGGGNSGRAGGGNGGGGFRGGHGSGLGGHYGGHYSGHYAGHGNHAWGGHGSGWGYRGRGWGYPAYGYGLGLGVGLGYGLSGGYGYYGGYPTYVYTDYGYYPPYNYGYYNYDPYGNGYVAGYVAGSSTPTYVAPNVGGGGSPGTGAAALPLAPKPVQNPTRALSAETKEFVDRGEAAFKAGDYAGAVQSLRHAVVDDPQNALITLMLGQALFATGNFEEAAGATQAAMRQLPKEQWGVIIANYEELYGKRTDYTEQLHDLEKAIKGKPAEPALRFLAGFHYAYLGFATEAVDQLDAGLKLAPRDEMARRLRNEMRAKLTNPTKAPAPLLPGLPDESDEPKDE